MSFFIKGKQSSRPPHRKNGSKTVRKRKSTKQPKAQEEISSSEDEGLLCDVRPELPSSEDEEETTQDKKLRMAKVYLAEIEKQEKRKREAGDLDGAANGLDINKRLREDYLRDSGKLRSAVAHRYNAADLENITMLKTKFLKKSITCVCLTSDEKFIFSGGKDGSIIKWSLEEKKVVGCLLFVKQKESSEIKGHGKAIMSVTVTTDAKFLAVSDETKDIQIRNPNNLVHIRTLSGHQNAVTDLVFRKDSHTLYSCSKDRTVKIWSLDEMTYIETLYGHQDAITAIDALSKECAITAGGRDTTVRLWKITEESQLIYNGHSGSIDVIKLINEENFISGGDDGTLCVWSVNKKKPLVVVTVAHGIDCKNGQPFWITSVASFLNTDLIASGSQDGFVRLWKLTEGFRTCTLLFTVAITGSVNSLVFSSDGRFLIAGVGSEHKFGRWNVIKSAKNCIYVIPLI